MPEEDAIMVHGVHIVPVPFPGCKARLRSLWGPSGLLGTQSPAERGPHPVAVIEQLGEPVGHHGVCVWGWPGQPRAFLARFRVTEWESLTEPFRGAPGAGQVQKICPDADLHCVGSGVG
jgi:hypothetical protein